ncbi:hypothetical protein PZ897_17720 [Hoeflea sp. YIM 152468]|uniref:DUF6949 family protein n=1 Tax=Hoeflea sp. YIM 152468 TaxID=3031759 RepID=UPI0023DA6D04|nr:hypothetical protein [Hoeflea sp. YIM 152468]MDF1610022.1 hypothetical protein [Hoeflea sp. YIM 152468]
MIYSFDVMAAVVVMVTGFSTSWVGVELVRLAGWREPSGARQTGHPGRMLAELVLAAVIGPRLLLTNGFKNWRGGLVSLPLYMVLTLVAAGWSVCSGIIVLEMAFASGYFLT